jgi:hypothetical protein
MNLEEEITKHYANILQKNQNYYFLLRIFYNITFTMKGTVQTIIVMLFTEYIKKMGNIKIHAESVQILSL